MSGEEEREEEVSKHRFVNHPILAAVLPSFLFDSALQATRARRK